MKHDLREDAKRLRQYLEQRLQQFSGDANDAPGDRHAPVSLVHVGFECEQDGYVAIVFDTRPTATPDGEWTMHIESGNNWIEFPQWGACTEAMFEDGSLELTSIDGVTRVFSPDSDEGFHAAFGDMIASEIQHAIRHGLFKALPRSDDCTIYVEEINGNYAWPEGDGLEPV